MRFFIPLTFVGLVAVPATILLFALHMYILSLLTAAFAIVTRLDSVRAVIRSGAIGKSPCVSGSPKTSDHKLMALFDSNPTVVGSAWGFFLQRRSAQGPVLSLRNYVGRRGEWWAAGTTIREVCDYYITKGMTLPSHPAIDGITIGAWLATGSHGNSGNAGMSSSSAIQAVKIVCCNPPSRSTVSYSKLRRIIDHQQDHIVTWVKFHNLVNNVCLQKVGFTVNSTETANRWLGEGAVLRVLFVGAARDGLGIRWGEPYSETDHVDPHCCSKCATFVQADICSTVCGCRQPDAKWRGLTTLRNANQWTPQIYPFETFIAVVGGVMNFEMVFRMDLNGKTLNNMCHELREMHKRIGGRTEIRYGKEVVFWDVSLRHSFVEPVKLLRDFGVQQVAFHPGKYNPGLDGGLVLVKIGDIYNPPTNKLIF
tara:strand:- start:9773 stop:11044 length:1272 start_codon:yes stop_codon:yes gene_type:complete